MFTAAQGLCQINYVGICTYTGREVDHIVPDSQGGTDDPWNLQLACPECHKAKSSDEGHIAQGHKVQPRERFSL